MRRHGKRISQEKAERAALEAGQLVYRASKDGYERLSLGEGGEIVATPVKSGLKGTIVMNEFDFDGYEKFDRSEERFREFFFGSFVRQTPAEAIEAGIKTVCEKGSAPGLILMNREDHRWLVERHRDDDSHSLARDPYSYMGVRIEIDDGCRDPRVITESAAWARRRHDAMWERRQFRWYPNGRW